MLAAGGLAGVAPAAPSAFTYIKIGLGPEAFAPKPYRMPEGYTLTDVVAEMEQRLANHVDLLLRRDDLPMLPLVFPRPDGRVRFAGDTDHLMRMDEWHVNEGDESE
jgi:ATP-dependent helicase/nuclease subunit B